jgi:hypothetical protein
MSDFDWTVGTFTDGTASILGDPINGQPVIDDTTEDMRVSLHSLTVVKEPTISHYIIDHRYHDAAVLLSCAQRTPFGLSADGLLEMFKAFGQPPTQMVCEFNHLRLRVLELLCQKGGTPDTKDLRTNDNAKFFLLRAAGAPIRLISCRGDVAWAPYIRWEYKGLTLAMMSINIKGAIHGTSEDIEDPCMIDTRHPFHIDEIQAACIVKSRELLLRHIHIGTKCNRDVGWLLTLGSRGFLTGLSPWPLFTITIHDIQGTWTRRKHYTYPDKFREEVGTVVRCIERARLIKREDWHKSKLSNLLLLPDEIWDTVFLINAEQTRAAQFNTCYPNNT